MWLKRSWCTINLWCRTRPSLWGLRLHRKLTYPKPSHVECCFIDKEFLGLFCRCNSNAFEEGTRFDILLLDESSQIIEPASVFPLTHFGARRFLALGDPKVLLSNVSRRNFHLHTHTKQLGPAVKTRGKENTSKTAKDLRYTVRLYGNQEIVCTPRCALPTCMSPTIHSYSYDLQNLVIQCVCWKRSTGMPLCRTIVQPMIVFPTITGAIQTSRVYQIVFFTVANSRYFSFAIRERIEVANMNSDTSGWYFCGRS